MQHINIYVDGDGDSCGRLPQTSPSFEGFTGRSRAGALHSLQTTQQTSTATISKESTSAHTTVDVLGYDDHGKQGAGSGRLAGEGKEPSSFLPAELQPPPLMLPPQPLHFKHHHGGDVDENKVESDEIDGDSRLRLMGRRREHLADGRMIPHRIPPRLQHVYLQDSSNTATIATTNTSHQMHLDFTVSVASPLPCEMESPIVPVSSPVLSSPPLPSSPLPSSPVFSPPLSAPLSSQSLHYAHSEPVALSPSASGHQGQMVGVEGGPASRSGCYQAVRRGLQLPVNPYYSMWLFGLVFLASFIALYQPRPLPNPLFSADNQVDLIGGTAMAAVGFNTMIMHADKRMCGRAATWKATVTLTLLIVCVQFAMLASSIVFQLTVSPLAPGSFAAAGVSHWIPLLVVCQWTAVAPALNLLTFQSGAGVSMRWHVQITLMALLVGNVVLPVTSSKAYFIIGASVLACAQLWHSAVVWWVRRGALSSSPQCSAPQRAVARYIIPFYLVISIIQMAARIAFLAGAVQLGDHKILRNVLHFAFVMMTSMLISNSTWLAKKEQEEVMASERVTKQVISTTFQEQRKLFRYMFHEIRSPLHSILMAVDDLPQQEHRAESARIIMDSGRQIAKLLDNCAFFTQVEDGQIKSTLAPCSPEAVLTLATQMLAPAMASKGLTAHLMLDVCMPRTISSNAVRLHQIIVSMLSNAIRFSPKHQELTCYMLRIGSDSRQTIEDMVACLPVLVHTEHESGLSEVPSWTSQRTRESVWTDGAFTMHDGLCVYTPKAQSFEEVDEKKASVNPLKISRVRFQHQQDRTTVRPMLPKTPLGRTKQKGKGPSEDLGPHCPNVGNGCVLFVVEDFGPGISATEQTKLFRPFEQISAGHGHKANSTGIGLSISKLLADDLGGEIGCWSQEGVGSRFWFTIPAAAQGKSKPRGSKRRYRRVAPAVVVSNSQEASACNNDGQMKAPELSAELIPATALVVTPATSPFAVKRGKVNMAVVVDDIDSNRLLLRRMAMRLGFGTVFTAEHGTAALTDASWLSADLWLVDRNMPVMDGTELCRQLRRRGYQGVIIGVTGDALPEDRAAFVSAGADAVLTKPCAPQTLRQALRDFGFEL